MNRAGMYHNNLKGAAAYQSFRPNPLPPVPRAAGSDNGQHCSVPVYRHGNGYRLFSV